MKLADVNGPIDGERPVNIEKAVLIYYKPQY